MNYYFYFFYLWDKINFLYLALSLGTAIVMLLLIGAGFLLAKKIYGESALIHQLNDLYAKLTERGLENARLKKELDDKDDVINNLLAQLNDEKKNCKWLGEANVQNANDNWKKGYSDATGKQLLN